MNISIIQSDITALEVEAIVNAAKPSLMGGGGVDGLIHQKGGDAIYLECERHVQQHGFCEPGNAVLTTAGDLPSKHVIHTVGPVWVDGDQKESQILTNCYKNVLEVCVKNGIREVAFPNISCGIYGFPKKGAARIAIRTARQFSEIEHIDRVIFVCFEDINYQHYTELIKEAVL